MRFDDFNIDELQMIGFALNISIEHLVWETAFSGSDDSMSKERMKHLKTLKEEVGAHPNIIRASENLDALGKLTLLEESEATINQIIAFIQERKAQIPYSEVFLAAFEKKLER
jgi:hypothetical protein